MSHLPIVIVFGQELSEPVYCFVSWGFDSNPSSCLLCVCSRFRPVVISEQPSPYLNYFHSIPVLRVSKIAYDPYVISEISPALHPDDYAFVYFSSRFRPGSL